jgi:hypothetical protein
MKFQLTILSLIVLFIPPISKAGTSTDSLLIHVLELERAVMESTDDTLRATLLLKKGDTYKQYGKHKEVVFTLNRINPVLLDDSLEILFYYNKAYSYFLLGSYQQALLELWNINSDKINSHEYDLLYLMVLLENERWEDFNHEYNRHLGKRGHPPLSQLNALQLPDFFDAAHYVKLSRYLPGLGLMKGGYYRRGFTSLGLQLGFVGFAVYNFSIAYYGTAVLSGLFPARKFNLGGRILTQSMIEQKNQKAIASCKQRGYTLIATLD